MDTSGPSAGPATTDIQSSPWLPRDSVKARVQCEDGFDLSHLLSEAAATPTWFATTLAGETRQVLAGLAEELRHLALPGLEHVEVELDDSNWRISGSAVPDHGRPRLSLSLGFALAVEEATLEFLSWEDALCPIQALRDRDPAEDRTFAVERYAFDDKDRLGRFPSRAT